MKKVIVFPLFLWLFTNTFAQKDKVSINDFRDHHVLYADFGISPAPFNITYPFSSEQDKLQYKNNFKPILGLAYAHKWFSMRIAFPVGQGARPSTKFGKSKQLGVGFDYNYNRLYTDVDLRFVQGYALKDAIGFDTTLIPAQPNYIYPSLNSLNLALNLWYFNHDDFKVNALEGKRAHFEKQVHTWYLKGTLNVFGIHNPQSTLIPNLLADVTNSKTSANTLSAVDIGIIPGYAYANRIKNWQFSGWAGFGAIVQSKFYSVPAGTYGHLGLATRYDIRFVGGYSNASIFLLLAAHFDNKSIHFNDFKYNQYFYTLRFIAGKRIAPKKSHQGSGHRPKKAG